MIGGAIDPSGIHPRGVYSCSVQQWIVLDHGLAKDANGVGPNIMPGAGQDKPLQH